MARRKRNRRKARIVVRDEPVILVNKNLLRLIDTKKKIIYLFLADRPVKYKYGRRSRIVYIGKTTRKGERPFESLKKKAPSLLQNKSIKPRIKGIEVVYLEAKGRQGANIVDMFERICLHEFRAYFGLLPYGNSKGNKTLELTNGKRYFSLEAIKKTLINTGSED